MSNAALSDQEISKSKDIRFGIDQWVTVRQFCQIFPWPTEPGLRGLFYGASIGKNSFKSAFRKVGRRVLVNASKLFALIDELNDCSSRSNDPSNFQKRGK